MHVSDFSKCVWFILGMFKGASELKDTGYTRWQGTILKMKYLHTRYKGPCAPSLTESWQPDLLIATIFQVFSVQSSRFKWKDLNRS